MSTAPVRKHRRPKHPVPPTQTTVAPAEADDQVPEETAAFIERDRRHDLIAEHAYFLAEQRGFKPGQELDDWLTAERNVEQAVASYDEGSRSSLCEE